MNDLLFAGWSHIGRTALLGLMAYVLLIVFLRVSGKRTLAKMNAFDLVVTVALGSCLATILLSKQVSLAQGMTAFATLILLQYLIAWTSVHSRLVRRLAKSEPTLLLCRGRFLSEAMGRERVTEEEIRAAIRSAGLSAVEAVEAVVLETDGSLSVLPPSAGEATALIGVDGRSSARRGADPG